MWITPSPWVWMPSGSVGTCERIEERVADVDAVGGVPVVAVRHGAVSAAVAWLLRPRRSEREPEDEHDGDGDREHQAALLRDLAAAAGAAARATFLDDDALPIGIER